MSTSVDLLPCPGSRCLFSSHSNEPGPQETFEGKSQAVGRSKASEQVMIHQLPATTRARFCTQNRCCISKER